MHSLRRFLTVLIGGLIVPQAGSFAVAQPQTVLAQTGDTGSLPVPSFDGRWIADLPIQGGCQAAHLVIDVRGQRISGTVTNSGVSYPVTGTLSNGGSGRIQINGSDANSGTIRFSATEFAAQYMNASCGLRAVVGRRVTYGAAAAPENSSIQLTPLQDYINQPGIEKDPAAFGYVMHRCAALYAVLVKIGEGETAPDRQKLTADLTDGMETLSGAAIQLMMRGTTMDVKEAQKRVVNLTGDLANLYAKRIEAVRLRTNSMFSDSLIAGDIATCGALLKKIQGH